MCRGAAGPSSAPFSIASSLQKHFGKRRSLVCRQIIDRVKVFRVVIVRERRRRRRRVGPSLSSPPSRRHEHDGWWCAPKGCDECVWGAKRCRARSAVGIDREDIIIVVVVRRQQQQQRVLPRRRRRTRKTTTTFAMVAAAVGALAFASIGAAVVVGGEMATTISKIGRRTRSSSSPHSPLTPLVLGRNGARETTTRRR